MRKALIVLFSILILLSVSLLFVLISFKNSYKYVIYKTQTFLQAQDIRGCEYFDFSKIVENGVQRTIRQSINLDISLNRAHDYETDVLSLQMMNNLKDSIIMQQKTICESQFQNYEHKNKYSDIEILFDVFTNYKYSKDKKMTVEKINKTKYDVEICDMQNKEDCKNQVYEKNNNKWYIVDLY